MLFINGQLIKTFNEYLVVRGRSSSAGIKVLKTLKTWVVSPGVKLPLTELNRFDFGWGETSGALY